MTPKNITAHCIRPWQRWRSRYIDQHLFIHINKTGGTSIEQALRLPHDHLTAMEMRSAVGIAKWNRRYTFTVVRNPWDRAVSHYHYRLRRNRLGITDRPPAFVDWIQLVYHDQDPRFHHPPKMFMPQVDWITDHGGTILVSHAWRFERLGEEYQRFARERNIRAPLPHVKASDRRDYRSYFDDRAIDTVAKWFAADIAQFGYDFDRPRSSCRT